MSTDVKIVVGWLLVCALIIWWLDSKETRTAYFKTTDEVLPAAYYKVYFPDIPPPDHIQILKGPLKVKKTVITQQFKPTKVVWAVERDGFRGIIR